MTRPSSGLIGEMWQIVPSGCSLTAPSPTANRLYGAGLISYGGCANASGVAASLRDAKQTVGDWLAHWRVTALAASESQRFHEGALCEPEPLSP